MQKYNANEELQNEMRYRFVDNCHKAIKCLCDNY